jgi:putative dehydrogenase
MRTIGFVGLGAMGAAMARQLVAKQFKVIGFDLNTAATEALAADGGHAAASVAQAAGGADALVVMVVNADQRPKLYCSTAGLSMRLSPVRR